ncbi:fungal specific transcription factor domain-containing protein [Colletotrichum incanum]|uniref:Fungal specific transcription factor domain-containing protein n=1 Tax=Colletotrichum incanum TaxID=1573173 RepID=A0A161VWP4_COLIC|nr:fungal specific transcription factor domain-containing protein [Colletotrichum incanum]
MLLRLMTFYQVMPQFLDFLHIYASHHGRDRELRFSGFRTDKTLANPISGTVIHELGRSGRRYQLCFNLKTVSLKEQGDWKIRQAVFHHQFDIGQGTQLWIIGDPHASLKRHTAELFPEGKVYPTSFSTVQQGFKSSLEVHLNFAQWATLEWRWHILYLEERAEELTKPARIREKVHIEKLEPESLSDVQNWEERTNDTIMAMESNVNILRLQQKFYRDIVKDDSFPRREQRGCQQTVKSHNSQLEELICETQVQIMRAKVLVKTVADRKTILIQHLQTQHAIVSSKLTVTMYEQADRSAVEAIAVRIVTIVTLIYLPATFSSTFFSTDVVKYQDGEVFSKIALERFLQVTLPLMFLTFVSAGLWFWVEWRRRAQNSRRIRRYFLDLFSQETEKLEP